MVTADDVRRVRIFADFEGRGCERLSRVAADISLGVGEYAAREGEERALFALLEGRIEAVKIIDGIDRVVGERSPGDIFGEVPITLGTLFPVGFRAAEPLPRYANRAAGLLRGRRAGAEHRQGGGKAGE